MQHSTWSGWYKIVQPTPESTPIQDNMNLDSSVYNNYSWYQNLVYGVASRITRYREYDIMDNDSDISRALDLIAEEMTTCNESDIAFGIKLNTDIANGLHPSVVSALNIALKQWYKKRGFDKNLYKIARNVIKYGDNFFIRRKANTSKETWEYVNSKNVHGAYVDENDVTNVLMWLIEPAIKDPKKIGNVGATSKVYDTYPANEIVRFTLNDDMSDNAPFGDSILSCVYRDHKRKELLEDAIVIYRIQRAPERRVFYLDVGKMSPQRTSQYLKSVETELKQKRIPSSTGGHNNVDSTYNPQSMSEDFFFAVRPHGNNSRVDVLPGGQNLGELTDLEHFRRKVLEGLRIPPSFLPNFQTADLNSNFSDGNTATAYMTEIQFYKYILRLQKALNTTIDREFKLFLSQIGVNIDQALFDVELQKPTNFEKYRQSTINANLLTQLGNADGVAYLSKRFILSKYLSLSQAEIAENETLLMQERGIKRTKSKPYVAIYNPDNMSGDDGSDMSGGMGGSIGGSMGGDIGDINLDDDTSPELDNADEKTPDDAEVVPPTDDEQPSDSKSK